MQNRTVVAMVFAVALGATPAMAQTTTGNGNTQAAPGTAATTSPAAKTKPERGTATINPTGIPPSQRNPLLADNGDVRIGKAIGTDVYNKNDKNLGSVDDVLAAADGKLSVVISANGKLVLVPWDKLQFGDAKLNGDNKILMPDETVASLKSMPAFHYKNQNKAAAPAPAATTSSAATTGPALAASPTPPVGKKK